MIDFSAACETGDLRIIAEMLHKSIGFIKQCAFHSYYYAVLGDKHKIIY